MFITLSLIMPHNFLFKDFGSLELYDRNPNIGLEFSVRFSVRSTGTCFIQKIYAPSSSLLHGKHLPFTPSPLRLNIFRLFVILSLTQLMNYIVTLPRYFSFRLPHLNITTGPPSNELDKNIQQKWHGENLSH